MDLYILDNRASSSSPRSKQILDVAHNALTLPRQFWSPVYTVTRACNALRRYTIHTLILSSIKKIPPLRTVYMKLQPFFYSVPAIPRSRSLDNLSIPGPRAHCTTNHRISLPCFDSYAATHFYCWRGLLSFLCVPSMMMEECDCR